MARAVSKIAVISPDLRAQLRTLFGTSRNAYARLGLQATCRRQELVAALAGRPVTPEFLATLTARWEQWRAAFLRPAADEPLCERMHDAYLDAAHRLDWPIRDGMDVPYADLSETAKNLDRAIASTIAEPSSAWARGDCYDPAARDPESGTLVFPDASRFTLVTLP